MFVCLSRVHIVQSNDILITHKTMLGIHALFILFVYIFTFKCLQYDFHIKLCWCHLTVRGAINGAGNSYPSRVPQ